jgi:hypothetical protein
MHYKAVEHVEAGPNCLVEMMSRVLGATGTLSLSGDNLNEVFDDVRFRAASLKKEVVITITHVLIVGSSHDSH